MARDEYIDSLIRRNHQAENSAATKKWQAELAKVSEADKIDNHARTGVMSRAERLRRRGIR